MSLTLRPFDPARPKVSRSTLRKLQRNRAQLRAVLLYHVVKGNVKAAQVVKLGQDRERSNKGAHKTRDHAWFIAYAPIDEPAGPA